LKNIVVALLLKEFSGKFHCPIPIMKIRVAQKQTEPNFSGSISQNFQRSQIEIVRKWDGKTNKTDKNYEKWLVQRTPVCRPLSKTLRMVHMLPSKRTQVPA
jgi:hypothetical protein